MQKTFSFKVSDKLKEELLEHFQDKKRDKTPQYALFQANEEDTIVTLYESNKIVFQGISSDIDYDYWKQKEYILTGKYPEEKEKKEEKKDNRDYYFTSAIGSDEVGTGDYFGPIVVTSSYVNKKDLNFLENLGVKDSKKLNDEKIIKIAPELIKNIKHKTIVLNNKDYNDNYSKDFNMNKIKAILHNKVLLELIKEDLEYDYIIVDQFAKEKTYYSYLKDSKSIAKNITFLTKAEEKNLAVAVASIISRYIFLKEIKRISNELNITIPKGASNLVDDIGKKILLEKGEKTLYNIVKLNFKNTQKIKDLL